MTAHGSVVARIADRRVLRLIRRYLMAGLLDNGLFEASREGTPQGGPLSPLLANLVLDELDRELERVATGSCATRTTAMSMSAAKGRPAVMACLTRFIDRAST